MIQLTVTVTVYLSVCNGVAGMSCFALPCLPPTTEEANAISHDVCLSVCLSVCLLARLLKNASMDLGDILRLDRCRDTDELINF